MLRTLLAASALLLLLGLAACTPEPTGPPPPPLAITPDGFVGNAACEPCHAAEFTSHAASRHMQTLLKADRNTLGDRGPATGPIPGGGRVQWNPMNLVLEMPEEGMGGSLNPYRIELVFGSGKTGMTYMVSHPLGSLELRMSYFPPLKKWLSTPGQENTKLEIAGRIHSQAETARCINCHAVERPQAPLPPEPRFFGVGCESCHGPGGAHALAMQKKDLSKGVLLTKLTGVGGAALNDACGKCHRTAASVEGMDAVAKASTQRFQPYGLSLSACFTKSADKLSCVTCHNPHTDASTDTKSYEKTCLSCHSTPPQKACPVNPKEKCIACHMPTRKVFPGTNYPIAMADHYIRIYRDAKPAR